ncbi:EamA family transporter [Kineococcus sp. T13]|uniref:EamA family transporter n=1 Tax=Kineococcus vitellinus TaxID=2696565 RepID=UPI001412F6D9|nr:EamA family transporter [Kineococcus vitellinus]NAZ75290.1 EamA family transporter [Kineococcus vitellinus]
MTTVTDDSSRRLASGLGFAVLSAASFGLSGGLARGLLDSGWSPGAVVLVRIGLAALVLAGPAALSLRGRWGALRRNAGLVVGYGLLAVGAAQFCYFSAVARMPVGPALLIEYTAPAAVVCWLWLRHGQRPGRLTAAGAALAALGLVLVLDLLTGTRLDTGGVLWALAAMVGAATYFVLSAREGTGLPPLALAGGGLLVAALALGLLGLAGVLPLSAGTAPALYDGRAVPWWVPLLGLGLVTAAVAYVAGIAAGRRLGSRLASFVALLEVVAGVAGAWLLLGELPRPVQLLGGVLVVAGVVVVKLGEPRTAPAALPQPSAAR